MHHVAVLRCRTSTDSLADRPVSIAAVTLPSLDELPCAPENYQLQRKGLMPLVFFILIVTVGVP